MPTRVKIPISKGLYTNSDALDTSDFATVNRNFWVNRAGALVKRPGVSDAVDLGTAKPVEGLYWFNEAGYAIAVSDGKVFKITKSGPNYSKTELTGSTLRTYASTGGTGRVVFCDDGTRVYMANGAAINYHTAASGTSQPIADADAPTQVTHVAFLNNRILCNKDGTSQFYWSDIGNGLAWTATSWATAESDADWVLNLSVGYKELVLWGEQTIEVWYDDGVTPFSPIPGAFIQRGLSSQDSVQFHDGKWYFQDERNNICMMKDRQVTVISKPIERELKELGNVTDGLSMLIDIAGDTHYVITYPTVDRTFVWKVSDDYLDGWSEWGQSTSGRWIGQCHAACTGWFVDLVGSKAADGMVYVYSTGNVDDDGTAITATRRTGWIDHGAKNWKSSLGISVLMKDAVNGNVSAPVLSFRYRDNGSATWSSWRDISMTGEAIRRVFQLGRYRTRQWEFQNSQRCLTDIVSIEEDVEVMTS